MAEKERRAWTTIAACLQEAWRQVSAARQVAAGCDFDDETVVGLWDLAEAIDDAAAAADRAADDEDA